QAVVGVAVEQVRLLDRRVDPLLVQGDHLVGGVAGEGLEGVVPLAGELHRDDLVGGVARHGPLQVLGLRPLGTGGGGRFGGGVLAGRAGGGRGEALGEAVPGDVAGGRRHVGVGAAVRHGVVELAGAAAVGVQERRHGNDAGVEVVRHL